MAIIRIMTPGESRAPHPYYHFHGFAGNQIAGDSKFFDIASGNHGYRGNDLSDAQMFATPGYVSTVNPVTGATDSTIHIPPVIFDYNSGEKLIAWWMGKCLAEGSGAYMMGDGYNSSNHGWAILVNSNQKLQIVLSGATQAYSGQSATLPFDGNLHSFGFVLDGAAKKYAFWVDEQIDTLFAVNGYIPLSAGGGFDTRTTATINIGTAAPAPGLVSNSLPVSTRALVILRLPASYAVPKITAVESTFKQLRADPSKLILASAL